MLRITLTSTRPVFRSSLTLPFSIIQQPYKYCSCTRLFHAQGPLQASSRKSKIVPEPIADSPSLVEDPAKKEDDEGEQKKSRIGGGKKRVAKKTKVPSVDSNSKSDSLGEGQDTAPKKRSRKKVSIAEGAEEHDTKVDSSGELQDVAPKKRTRKKVSIEKGAKEDDTKVDSSGELQDAAPKKRTRKRASVEKDATKVESSREGQHTSPKKGTRKKVSIEEGAEENDTKSLKKATVKRRNRTTEQSASKAFLESIGIEMPDERAPKSATSRPSIMPIWKKMESNEVDMKLIRKLRQKITKKKQIKVSAQSKKLAEELEQLIQGPSVSKRKRVDVVSGELCDDIIERLKPSLTKHFGCDILDLSPGACVWSSKIHDFLKPRTHVLVEQDVDTYKPYIQPLLDAPGSTYRLCVKPPLVWSEVESVLTEDFFPLQETYPKGDPRLDKPNDTMLVLVNLAFFPKQPYKGFASITPLLLNQFSSAAMSHALHQKYGQVRVLVWIADEERTCVLPRHILFRRKSSLEAEIASKITEVASSTESPNDRFWRDPTIEVSFGRKVLKEMERLGIKTPEGRESAVQNHILKYGDEAEELALKLSSNSKNFTFHRELTELEEEWESGDKIKYISSSEGVPVVNRFGKFNLTPGASRLHVLQAREQAHFLRNRMTGVFVSRHQALLKELAELHGIEGDEASLRREELNRLRKDLVYEMENLPNDDQVQLTLTRADNNRVSYLEGKSLFQYDRRAFEPLRTFKEEFYPSNTELALLDMEPRPIWPVLRKNFPENLDILQHILGKIFIQPQHNVKEALLGIWPGAYEYLVQECPSLTDPRIGGDPDLELIPVRCLPLQCFREIIEAWERWPHKPSREDLWVHGAMWDSSERDEIFGRQSFI